MTTNRRTPQGAGIGLRLPHLAEIVAARPSIDWLEVHPENVLANPHAAELLTEVARDYPISVHTVGLSAHNMGYDAYRYIDGLPADAIGEVHLGGFTPEEDGANPGAELFVDTHATDCRAGV